MKKMSELPRRPGQATVRLRRAARVEGHGFNPAAKTLSRFTPRKGASAASQAGKFRVYYGFLRDPEALAQLRHGLLFPFILKDKP